eukprot:15366293-Ditylum_brightwellii.AAC.2
MRSDRQEIVSLALLSKAPASCSAPATNSLGEPLVKDQGAITIFWVIWANIGPIKSPAISSTDFLYDV